MIDHIVEEVRKVRAEHAALFNNDLHRIVADLKSRQKRHGNQLVRLPAKLLSKRVIGSNR